MAQYWKIIWPSGHTGESGRYRVWGWVGGFRPVLTDWAIFESSLMTNYPTKVAQIVSVWTLLKSIISNLKLLWLVFGAFLEKFGVLFIPTSGHTGFRPLWHLGHWMDNNFSWKGVNGGGLHVWAVWPIINCQMSIKLPKNGSQMIPLEKWKILTPLQKGPKMWAIWAK